MGKRSRMSLWVVVVLLIVPTLAQAKEAKGQRPAAAPEISAAARAERAAKETEAVALLNGTKWSIELIPLSGEKAKRPLKDTLKFEKGKVLSEAMSKEGYPTTNFTLTMNGNTPVWETMQTKEGSGVCFWRGERQGEAMRGILSKHPTEGPSVDLSFSGNLIEAKPTAPEASKPPPPSVESAAPSAAASPKVTAVQASVSATASSETTASTQTTKQTAPPASSQKPKKGWLW